MVASYYDAEQQYWSEPIADLKKITRDNSNNIAWVKSPSQIDNLSIPSNEQWSMVILNENNTEDVYTLGNHSGWHHTVGALKMLKSHMKHQSLSGDILFPQLVEKTRLMIIGHGGGNYTNGIQPQTHGKHQR